MTTREGEAGARAELRSRACAGRLGGEDNGAYVLASSEGGRRVYFAGAGASWFVPKLATRRRDAVICIGYEAARARWEALCGAQPGGWRIERLTEVMVADEQILELGQGTQRAGRAAD